MSSVSSSDAFRGRGTTRRCFRCCTCRCFFTDDIEVCCCRIRWATRQHPYVHCTRHATELVASAATSAATEVAWRPPFSGKRPQVLLHDSLQHQLTLLHPRGQDWDFDQDHQLPPHRQQGVLQRGLCKHAPWQQQGALMSSPCPSLRVRCRSAPSRLIRNHNGRGCASLAAGRTTASTDMKAETSVSLGRENKMMAAGDHNATETAREVVDTRRRRRRKSETRGRTTRAWPFSRAWMTAEEAAIATAATTHDSPAAWGTNEAEPRPQEAKAATPLSCWQEDRIAAPAQHEARAVQTPGWWDVDRATLWQQGADSLTGRSLCGLGGRTEAAGDAVQMVFSRKREARSTAQQHQEGEPETSGCILKDRAAAQQHLRASAAGEVCSSCRRGDNMTKTSQSRVIPWETATCCRREIGRKASQQVEAGDVSPCCSRGRRAVISASRVPASHLFEHHDLSQRQSAIAGAAVNIARPCTTAAAATAREEERRGRGRGGRGGAQAQAQLQRAAITTATREGGSTKTGEHKCSWERALWKKEQRRLYADNYLDDSFLCGLISDARTRSYTYCSLCSATVVITQHLSLLTIFIVVYVRFRRQRTDGVVLVLLSVLLLLLGHALRWMLRPSWRSKIYGKKSCSQTLISLVGVTQYSPFQAIYRRHCRSRYCCCCFSGSAAEGEHAQIVVTLKEAEDGKGEERKKRRRQRLRAAEKAGRAK